MSDPSFDPGGRCAVTFRFVKALTLESEEITCVAQSGHDIFVGTKSGVVLKYRTRKHLHRDGRVNFTNKLLQHRLITAKKPITKLEVVTGNLNYLLVLCNGVLTIHRLKDLLLHTRVPRTEISTFCCSDGSPYYGLAICQGKKLFLYDLHQGFKAYKAVNLPEQPRSLQWIRKHICLGFRKQYSIIGTDQQPKLLCHVSNHPVIQTLPIEELVLAVKNKALFSFANGKKSREGFDLESIPIQFEIHNLIDPAYHRALRRPSNAPIHWITSDGKDMVATEAKTVYILVPNDTNYWVMDPVMFREVRKSPMDKVSFVRYVSQLMRSDNNPFHVLLNQYADRFVTRFYNPEDADLEVVKKFLLISMRKFYKVILSYFKHFKMKSCRQLLYGVIQTSYYSKIYWMLYAMITCRFKPEDLRYYNEVTSFQHYTPDSLGVGKRFWLMEESLEDPPKKRQPVEADESMPKPSPKKQTQQQQDFALPSGPMPDVNPAEEEPDYDYAALIVEEEGFIRYEPGQYQSQKGEAPKRPASRRSSMSLAQKFTHSLSEDVRDIFITDDVSFSLNVEVDLHELIDPLSGSRKIQMGILSVDPAFQLFIKIAEMDKPIYIRPVNHFAFSQVKQSMTWEQNKRHYRIIFNDEYEYEDTLQQLTVWQDSNFFDAFAHPESDAIIEELCESTAGKTDDLFSLDPDSESLDLDELVKKNKLFGKGEVKSPEEARPATTNINTINISTTSSDRDISASDTPNDPVPKIESPKQGHKPQPSGVGRAAGESPFTDDDVQLEFRVEPYRRAIQTLRKISFLKSPRDKLGCILHTFMDVIQCVTDFWDVYERDPVVSADDLVPIFSYVILKAHVPKLYSEMNFIWEFATDSEMKGKYGYSFATFQIGVEVIARLSQEEAHCAAKDEANAVKESSEPTDIVAEPIAENPNKDSEIETKSDHHALQDIKSKRDNNLNTKRSKAERRMSRSNNTNSEQNDGFEESGDYYG